MDGSMRSARSSIALEDPDIDISEAAPGPAGVGLGRDDRSSIRSGRSSIVGVAGMDGSNSKRSARSSIVVLPCTKAVPKRKDAIPYSGKFSDLYDDEQSVVNGI